MALEYLEQLGSIGYEDLPIYKDENYEFLKIFNKTYNLSLNEKETYKNWVIEKTIHNTVLLHMVIKDNDDDWVKMFKSMYYLYATRKYSDELSKYQWVFEEYYIYLEKLHVFPKKLLIDGEIYNFERNLMKSKKLVEISKNGEIFYLKFTLKEYSKFYTLNCTNPDIPFLPIIAKKDFYNHILVLTKKYENIANLQIIK